MFSEKGDIRWVIQMDVTTSGLKKIHARQKLSLVTAFILMPVVWISGVIDAIRNISA